MFFRICTSVRERESERQRSRRISANLVGNRNQNRMKIARKTTRAGEPPASGKTDRKLVEKTTQIELNPLRRAPGRAKSSGQTQSGRNQAVKRKI